MFFYFYSYRRSRIYSSRLIKNYIASRDARRFEDTSVGHKIKCRISLMTL